MNIRTLFVFFALLSGFSAYVFAQQNTAEMQAITTRQQEENRRRQEQRELERKSLILNNMQNQNRESRSGLKKAVLSKKDKAVRDKFTAPAGEDAALFKDFLKQPGTGIFRLFPDNDCLTDGVVKVDGKCRDIYPGTWFYSFREEDYSDGFFFDLQLKNGKLLTDGFVSQGMLVKLGNFSLDKVTPESPGAKFLIDFNPAKKAAEIKAQYAEIGRGIESEGYQYSRAVTAKVGEIYLLRVIAYRVNKKLFDEISLTDEARALNYIILNQDKREDLTIALRIIREDAGGNLTIIWKELGKKKSPEVVFAE